MKRVCAVLAVAMVMIGCHGSRSSDLSSRLLTILQTYDVPALAAAVVTSDGIRVQAVVGVRKYGTATPATLDDQFHLGSDTKAMTATILAMLVEQGKLRWDMTLAQCLPELAGTMDPAYRNVTLEQMLAHRAGFTDDSWPKGETFLSLHNWLGSPTEQRWRYAQMILREPPSKSLPENYLYSNRSYAIAGVIAERITGDSWEDLMRTQLFAPLEMGTCGFGAMGAPGAIDEPWQHTLQDGQHQAIEPGLLTDNPDVIAPAALVHCSIGDWAKFIQAHLRGEKGEPGILKPESFRRLHTATFGDYGFGWIVAQRSWGGRVLTHTGSNNQNYAVVWMAPMHDYAVLVATNQGGDKAFEACDKTVSMLIANYGSR
jgi:CubicO group peptidase (beta-lactamase class C family)